MKSINFILPVFLMLLIPFFVVSQESSIPQSVTKSLNDEIRLGNESEEKSDFNLASFYFHKVGNTYWSYGDNQKAITYFQKALAMSQKLGNLNAQFVLNNNIGLIYSDIFDYSNALKSFTEATAAAEKMGRKNDVTSSMLNRANVLYELARYDEAISVLNRVLANAQELNDAKLLRNTYSVLTKVYDKIGNRDESAKYFDLFAAITRKVQQDEMRAKEEEANKLVSQAKSRVMEIEAEKVATEKELQEKDIELMQKQRFLERAEQESRARLMKIELLSKESELQQAIIRQQQLMRNVYLIIIITTLIIAALIYYNYREKKKANLLLQSKNEEISRQNVEIQSQAEQLKGLNLLKDKLFSIIAHDLRSPLGSLITLLNLTRQGYFTEAGFKDVLVELSKNVDYTSTLLENLLVWAQSQMRGTVVNQKEFELFELVENKINLFDDQIKGKNIKIKNLIEKSTTLYADKDMIELVIRNLIANAIKFTTEQGEIIVSSRVAGNMMEVCVSDSGIGISKENLPKLFGREIFTTRGTLNEKGTGLGLILCKEFVELNGGRIWVESIVNKGSKFFFSVKRGDISAEPGNPKIVRAVSEN